MREATGRAANRSTPHPPGRAGRRRPPLGRTRFGGRAVL